MNVYRRQGCFVFNLKNIFISIEIIVATFYNSMYEITNLCEVFNHGERIRSYSILLSSF